MKSVFVKDLSYVPPHAIRDKESCKSFLLAAQRFADEGSYGRLVRLLLQAKLGEQVWVTKAVSDDLLRSHIDAGDIKFEDIVWPGRYLEFYFEDPAIPTFWSTVTNDQELNRDIAKVTGSALRPLPHPHDPRDYVGIQCQTLDDAMCSASHTYEEMDEFAAGGDLPKCDNVGRSSDLASVEVAEMRQLLILMFKVLLFANSEGHEVRRTREKPTRKQGGKPGFKNRPHMDRFVVEYLPHHYREKREAEAEEKSGKRQFLGRNGHWRHFRAERYVNKRGTVKFIYPVLGPDGTVPKRKFVVRKVG